MQPWRKLGSREACRGKVLAVREDVLENPRTGDHVTVQVVECPDWVNVIVTTPSEEVVLIKQFRFGSARVELEIPGGTVEPGEDPATAAAREAREETGYASKSPPVYLGQVNPNPAIHGHACHTYWIPDATRIGDPEFDGPNERCEVVLATMADTIQAIRDGTINHGLVIDAIFFHLLRAGCLDGSRV